MNCSTFARRALSAGVNPIFITAQRGIFLFALGANNNDNPLAILDVNFSSDAPTVPRSKRESNPFCFNYSLRPVRFIEYMILPVDHF